MQCRDIELADLPGVITVLTEGFADQRGAAFWQQGLARLTARTVPEGYPRYGTLLEAKGGIEGVILQIFCHVPGTDQVRCNMSSWYVRPAFRLFGTPLISRAFRHAATYTNITPAPQTIPILRAQGYLPFCQGRLITPAWLARSEPARVAPFTEDAALADSDRVVLREHAGFGCISLVARAGGQSHPFVFAPRRRMGVGLAVLTYAGVDAGFARFAAPLGRYLARRGFPLVVLDADGPIPGLPGRFDGARPKFYRGPNRPRIDDHAYSERAVFGS